MKFFPKTEAKIIEFADNPVVLKRQEGESYVYEIRYLANPKLVLQLKALKSVIKVSTENLGLNKTEKVFTNYNPESINKKLQTKSGRDIDSSRSSNSKVLFSKTSDITSRISKSALQSIKRQENPTVGNRLIVKPIKKSDADNENYQLPILEKNRNKTIEQNLSQREVRQLFLERLKNDADPSEELNKGSSIISSADSVKGTGKPSRELTRLQKAFLGDGAILESQNQLSSNDFIPALVRESFAQFEIREEFKIPISLITDEFYVTIDILNSKDLILNRIYTSISHLEHINLLSIPRISPKLSRKYIPATGRNIITVQQNDRNAEGVELFRRAIKKSRPNHDAAYESVVRVPLRYKEITILEDRYPTSDYLVYRVVPYGSDDKLASIYSGVASGNKKTVIPNKTGKFHQSQKNLFLLYRILDNGVEIAANNIPSDVVSMQILRKNLTNKQAKFSYIGKPLFVGDQEVPDVKVVDKDIKKNRIYEYGCEITTKQGNKEVAFDTKIVEYTPIQENVLRLTTSGPITIEEDELDIQFTINKEIIQSNFDTIKTTFQEQGLSAEFLDEIKDNREKLQDMFAIRVLRYNLGTGEEEDFGIIQSLDFSDKKFGRVKSVKPLEPNQKYRYMLYAYARNPETLFPKYTKTVDSEVNGQYSYKPFKWRNPIILSQGNIVSETTIQKNYVESLTFGGVVDIASIDIGTVQTAPNVVEAKATQIRDNEIMIEWKTNGGLDLVDHFVIVLENLGMSKIVGKTHAISSTNVFRFIDSLENNERGQLTYLIYPILFNFTKANETKTNTILV